MVVVGFWNNMCTVSNMSDIVPLIYFSRSWRSVSCRLCCLHGTRRNALRTWSSWWRSCLDSWAAFWALVRLICHFSEVRSWIFFRNELISKLDVFLVICIIIFVSPCRRFPEKEEVPPSGLSYSHSQQHISWGDCCCPAHSALSWPVEQPDKWIHQHSAKLCWRCYGRLPVWSCKRYSNILGLVFHCSALTLPLCSSHKMVTIFLLFSSYSSVSWKSIFLILRDLEWAFWWPSWQWLEGSTGASG